MNCDICNSETVLCTKCNVETCNTCNDNLYCELENGYICNVCYYVYDIKIFKCNGCKVSCCTDCRECVNCYLMLCDRCIENKVCSCCTYEFKNSLCIKWYNAILCTCCLCVDIEPCDSCINYDIVQCENILQCICKRCFVCTNSNKHICENCIKICKQCFNLFNKSHIGDVCNTCKFQLVKTTQNDITKTLPQEIVDLICSK